MIRFEERDDVTVQNPPAGEVVLFYTDGAFRIKDSAGEVTTITTVEGLEEVAEATEPKVYVALLTQSGTNAPVATVLKNTLGSEVVWSYTFAGTYNGATTNSIFSPTKTIGYAYSGWDDDSTFLGFIVSVFDSNNISLTNTINDQLDNHDSIRVKIEVYP